MGARSAMLDALGGEAGCKRLSAAFYARVAADPTLRPLFPGKSFKCATEELAAFLIELLGGDEEKSQARWWLSLKESHSRFRIGPAERAAWLGHMNKTLDDAPLEAPAREALREFFAHSSAYVIGQPAKGSLRHDDLSARWAEQRYLDETVDAIACSQDERALAMAQQISTRPSMFVGLLQRMMQTGRPALVRFVVETVEGDPSLGVKRFSGRSLLHFAAGAGCVEVVAVLLRLGVDPNLPDRGGHTPLYRVANECATEAGPELARMLADAGADANAAGGATRATPLHMAARRGFVSIARALLDCGAAIDARDSKGVTPLQRALNCRQAAVARLLSEAPQAARRGT